MSVAIINLTGNRKGFEDEFVTKLSRLTNQSSLISLRGEEVLAFQGVDPDVKLLVFVCHGLRNSDDTKLDLGLKEHPYLFNNYFSSPYLLSTFSKNIASHFIVVYFVCDSFSPETIVAFDNQDNCLGSIASITAVDTEYFAEMACFLDQIYDVLTTGRSKGNITSNINKILKICSEIEGLKDIVFTENLIVTENEG
jgi:hypothetical protein